MAAKTSDMRTPFRARAAQNVLTFAPADSAASIKAFRSLGTRYFLRPRLSYKDQGMHWYLPLLPNGSRLFTVDFPNAVETKSAILSHLRTVIISRTSRRSQALGG